MREKEENRGEVDMRGNDKSIDKTEEKEGDETREQKD